MRIGRFVVLPLLWLGLATLPVSASTPQLIGTWIITIQPPAPSPSFIAISTFAADGTTVGSPPAKPPPGVVGAGDVFGVWKEAGDANTYESTVVALTYDKGGMINGSVKFNNHYAVRSKDEFEGISQFQICDLKLTCQEPAPRSANLQGMRLQMTPLR